MLPHAGLGVELGCLVLLCSRQAIFCGGHPGIELRLSLSSQEAAFVMTEHVAMSTDRNGVSPQEAMHPDCFALPSTGSKGPNRHWEEQGEPRENSLRASCSPSLYSGV